MYIAKITSFVQFVLFQPESWQPANTIHSVHSSGTVASCFNPKQLNYLQPVSVHIPEDPEDDEEEEEINDDEDEHIEKEEEPLELVTRRPTGKQQFYNLNLHSQSQFANMQILYR